MQKSLPIHDWLCLLMRISLVQFLLLVCGTVLATARPSEAQDVLNRRISLRADNQPLRTVLDQIGQQADVRFSYTTNLVASPRRVQLSVQNEALSTVLDQLLRPLNIGYVVVSKRIVLRPIDTPKATDNRLIPATDVPTAVVQAPQDRTVRGQVRGSDSNDPLPGVTVLIKGTQRGTSTDSEGRYEIQIPDGPNTVLVFSYVGYDRREMPVGNLSTLNVTLGASPNALSEVVVVGYGEQSRKLLSTSVARVEGRDLATQRVSTPGEALAGLAAGVQVQQNVGQPGSAPIIRIRGISTLGNNTPLFVVDGYPLLSANQFNLINPSDIESIEVLKDAASAAIYGSRASNGVVIVTTRKGQAGKTRFDVNLNAGSQEVAKYVDVMNAAEFKRFVTAAAPTWGRTVPTALTDAANTTDTDWQRVIFRPAAFQDLQVSASGGTEKGRFLISGGYLNQQGTLVGTSFERYTLRANYESKLTNKLRVGVNFAPSYGRQYRQPAGGPVNSSSIIGDGSFLPRATIGIVHAALLMPPVIPVKYDNGIYAQPSTAPAGSWGAGTLAPTAFSPQNPLAPLELNTHRLTDYRVLAQSFLEYSPLPALRLRSNVGASLEVQDLFDYYHYNWGLGGPANTAVTGQPWAGEGTNRDVDLLWENTATYTRSFGNHNLTAVAFYSLQRNTSKFLRSYGRDNSYNQLSLQNPFGATDVMGDLGVSENAWYSLGGRVNYDYNGKYLLGASLRQDGSSRFGPARRSAYFPAASVAWRIGQEAFLKNNAILSDLKIRASYGVTGNANIGSFAWAAGSVRANQYTFNNNRVAGVTYGGLTNADLTWERATQVDIGLDAELLRSRVFLTLDWYSKVNRDFLFNADVAGSYGTATSFLTNAGRIQNEGIELQLGTNLDLGQVRWRANLNLSRITNRVQDLNGQPQLPPRESVFGWNNVFRIRNNEPLGQIWSYQKVGIFRTQADLDNNPQWNGAGGNRLGDYIIRDNNGDGKITVDDMAIVGNAFPDLIFGFSSNLDYKGFDLSLLLNGTSGNKVINSTKRFLYQGFGNYNQTQDFADNWFDPANPTRDVAFGRLGTNVAVNPINNQMDNTIEDGSFLRVRNVTLGYTLPRTLLDRLKMQSVRVYFSGQNLLTFTKYSGYNPEVSLNFDNQFAPGVDQGTYPISRIYTAGLNLSF
jgi:TonB-linked SusC/RagA family outer membrane protein